MEAEKRLGSIEIEGVEYPLNYSIRVAQRYNEIVDEKTVGEFALVERNIRVLALLMENGAEYRRVFRGEKCEPLTEEQLKLCLTAADNERICNAIIDTINRAGARYVEAAPGKNGEAAQEDAKKQAGKKA